MKSRGRSKKLIAESVPAYCAICGERQRSGELWNHRDARGNPCVSYLRKKVQA